MHTGESKKPDYVPYLNFPIFFQILIDPKTFVLSVMFPPFNYEKAHRADKDTWLDVKEGEHACAWDDLAYEREACGEHDCCGEGVEDPLSHLLK